MKLRFDWSTTHTSSNGDDGSLVRVYPPKQFNDNNKNDSLVLDSSDTESVIEEVIMTRAKL